MTKGRLCQYLKEIRDKMLENQIFRPRYIPLENRSKFPSISLPMFLFSTTDQYFYPQVEIVHFHYHSTILLLSKTAKDTQTWI